MEGRRYSQPNARAFSHPVPGVGREARSNSVVALREAPTSSVHAPPVLLGTPIVGTDKEVRSSSKQEARTVEPNPAVSPPESRPGSNHSNTVNIALANNQATIKNRQKGLYLAWADDGEATSEFPPAPLSPLSKFVRGSLSERPSLAVVHTIPLRDITLVSNKESTAREETKEEDLYHPHFHHGQHSRPSSSAGLQLADSIQFHSSSALRPIPRATLVEKGANASQFFHQAQDVNRRARSNEVVDLILADVRRHKAEAKNSHAPPPPLVVKEVVEEVTESECSEKVAEPKRVSLMEKFGYGVKLTTQQPHREPSKESVLPTKKNGMVGVQFKKNDLKERLAARRHTVE